MHCDLVHLQPAPSRSDPGAFSMRATARAKAAGFRSRMLLAALIQVERGVRRNCDDDDDDDDDRRPTETRASTHTNTTQQCASMLALRMSRTNGFLGLARSQAEATRFKEDGKLPKSSRRLSAS